MQEGSELKRPPKSDGKGASPSALEHNRFADVAIERARDIYMGIHFGDLVAFLSGE